MINKIIEFSVLNRSFIYVMAALLILLGLKSFNELPIDAVPDITNTQVQINTQIQGLVPEEIERMVTTPIEQSMNGIPGVETVRSITRYGISQVTVIFEEHTDVFRARQLVAENLQNVSLPEGLAPELGPISTGLGEIFHYSLEAKEVEGEREKRILQLMELRSLQEYFVRPRLLTVKGVTEVNTIGGHEKQFFIIPNIQEMAKYGIHFDDIEVALKNVNINVGGGYIQQTGTQFLVRATGLLKNTKEIENIVIKKLSSLQVVKIKDLAQVRIDKQIRTGAGTVNGEEAVVGTAFMLLGENSRTVSSRVANKIEEIKKDLPPWAEIKVLYDRSQMVNATLGTVEHNLVMGASLVIIFLLLLVGNFRAALITAAVIPISLLMTFILMKWRGVSGNLMSLGALDFGIIIDGAVIVVEHCVHKVQEKIHSLNRNLSRAEVIQLVKDSAIEIRKAAGFGELVVIVVFLPIFALSGVEGKMFVPMATTFIMALSSALLLSFTLVPAMCASFLSGNTKDNVPFLMRLSTKMFRPSLNFALKHPKKVFTVGIASIFVGFFLFNRLGAEFIPQLDEGDFAVQFIRPNDIGVDQSIKFQMLSERVIKEFPQVKDVFARTGAAEVATDPMGVNISDSYVMLWPREKWPHDNEVTNKKQLMEKIKDKLELFVPAQVLLISQPVELRFNELLEGTRADVSAKIFGEDLEELTELSQKMAEIVAEVPGAGEVESESKGKSPVLEFAPKTGILDDFGVSARPLLDTVEVAIGGREVGILYDGIKKIPLVIRLSDEDRKNLDILKELPVGVSDGFTVPISKVADIKFSETYSAIARENGQRRGAILINPETRDIESFVEEASKRVSSQLKLPEGYFVEWGGSFKNLRQAKESLTILVPIAMLIILLMLYTAFKNIYQVTLIFICAPMALIGGVLALNIFQMPFSISAGVGFIAVSGIAILNGVVLMNNFNQLSSEGIGLDDIVMNGTISRLRPVLMTALTDIFGFMPMIFSSGLGAEVQKPLAAVVVGGIVSSTILTLVVLPCSFKIFSRLTYRKI